MAEREHVLTGERMVVSECAQRTCIIVRGDAGDMRFRRAVAAVSGVEPASQPGSAVAGLLASVLWLGPDEWMIVSETQRGIDVVPRLRAAFAAVHAAVIDVGAASIVYAVDGPSARDVLAKGCALDLDARIFHVGHCTRTLLAQVAVLLHLRSDAPGFELYVPRSYRDYVRSWFAAAARELVTDQSVRRG